ncbi:UNVERIFIED_CONTAM: hypothetical protein GTU68_023513 [Idotea baltica]
MVGKS